MPDYSKPIALKLPDGNLIPARPAGLDFDGTGRGEIRINFYTTQFLTTTSRTAQQLGPDDLGIDQEAVDELTGKSRYGTVINVQADILPDYIEPATGKVRMVSELEARRREQQAATRGTTASKQRIILEVSTHAARVVSVEAMP